jgi:DNA polymerase-4
MKGETEPCVLKLRDLPGVGAKMERHLNEQGIQSMSQLLAFSREQMNQTWGGIGGEKLWHWLRGEDFNDPELDHQKSISQSHVLPPELRTPEGCYAVAHKLLHKAAMRLRGAHLWTAHLSLSIKFAVSRADAQKLHNSSIPQSLWSHGITVIEC